jgi:hypothetical protein
VEEDPAAAEFVAGDDAAAGVLEDGGHRDSEQLCDLAGCGDVFAG